SRDCFEIGWSMRLDHSFFCVHPPNKPKVKKNSENRRKKKKDDDEELSSLSPNDGERRKKEEDDNEEHRATTEEDRGPTWLGKTNFVEIRSFLQIFRSFDRMWSFLIMSLQAMILIIIACYELKSPIQLLDEGIFENIMSIFITYSILKFIQ
ncbi:hypothetical protein UlMin_015096, partial [Ulmus minor]